jgi:hypothetical protein
MASLTGLKVAAPCDDFIIANWAWPLAYVVITLFVCKRPGARSWGGWIGEGKPGSLGRTVTTEREEFPADAWDEMGGVSIGCVDDVSGCDGATRGVNYVRFERRWGRVGR